MPEELDENDIPAALAEQISDLDTAGARANTPSVNLTTHLCRAGCIL
ncbi:MAG: hypothetical protein ACLR56_11065 [Oscillospiraceae bacterium]